MDKDLDMGLTRHLDLTCSYRTQCLGGKKAALDQICLVISHPDKHFSNIHLSDKDLDLCLTRHLDLTCSGKEQCLGGE